MLSGTNVPLADPPPPGWIVNRTHPLAPRLVAFWPFNQLGGQVAQDASQNGRHAALQNPNLRAAESGWKPTSQGMALSMSTGVLDFARFTAYTCPFPVSFSVWLYPWADGDLSTRDLIAPNADYGWKVRNNNKLSFYDGSSFHDATTLLTTLKWWHLGVSIGKAGNLAFYVNGQPDGTGSITPQTNSWQFLGRFNNFVTSMLQNFGFWDRELSPGEFSTLYSDPWGMLSPPALRLLPPIASAWIRRYKFRHSAREPRAAVVW